MDALAAEAFLNANHRVYGLALKPMSLGHAFTLEAIGSPFYYGNTGNAKELQLAAWICSRPPLAVPSMTGLQSKIWRMALPFFDYEKELSAWRVYAIDHVSGPQFWNKPAKPGESAEPSKIPPAVSTAVRLMRLGMTEQQAWATPVGVASWYEAASYEAEAGVRLDIVTDAERLAIIRAKSKQAAKEQNV